MKYRETRLATLEDVEKQMSHMAEHWHKTNACFQVSGEVLRDISDSLFVIARELKALRESKK